MKKILKPGPCFALLILLICFLRFRASIDLSGYLDVSEIAWAKGFQWIPYPDASSMGYGAYFQSPLITILLTPLSLLPRVWGKFLWAVLNVFLLIYLYRKFLGPSEFLKVFFLVLVFAHGLSDVFLSANLAFTVLGLTVLGWEWTQKKRSYPLGIAVLSALPFFRPQAFILFLWFWWIGKKKQALHCLAGLLAWCGFTFLCLSQPLKWWTLWWKALALYPQSVGMWHEGFQSPTALLFRVLTLWMGIDAHIAERWIMMVATFGFLALSLYSARKYRQGMPEIWALALLLTGHFLLNPFSWAVTALFLFPLALLVIQKQVPPIAWVGAVYYAVLPKAIWPIEIWTVMAKYGVPSLGFILVTIGLFKSLKSRTRLQ